MSLQALRLGWRLGRARLDARRTLSISLLCFAVTAAVAVAERSGDVLQAPTRTLNAVLGLIVPLAAMGFTWGASGGDQWGPATWTVARFGWSRGTVAGGSLLWAALPTLATALGALLVGMVIAYGGHAGLAADLRLSLPIALLATWAHFSWLAFGGTWLSRGRGRWLAFGCDLVLGSTTGLFALPFPRGHVRNLLGGEPVLELAQSTSSLALALVALTWTGAVLWRVGR